jgi:hypothetical protein
MTVKVSGYVKSSTFDFVRWYFEQDIHTIAF